jgi:3-hydroxyacyl-[acyl-carrier-protein] dehydratase
VSRAGATLWGPEVIEHLVPHRRPLWLVDCVLAWDGAPRPTVSAARYISHAEPVFAGHFPERPVWPGAYTIEGLAQTCRILATLERLAAGGDRATFTADLRNLQRALRGESGADPAAARTTTDALRALGGPGLLASVDVRLTGPIHPGCRLDYRATIERALDDLVRFAVEASVDGEPVAHGTLTSSRPRS